jgi:hypothetical protein
MKRKILLVTAKRSGTEQTKDVALNLSSYIQTFEMLRDFYKESFVSKYPAVGYSSSSSTNFLHFVLMGTVKEGFSHGKLVKSVKAKKIDVIAEGCWVTTTKDGFELSFSYKNVGSYLKAVITHEMIGIKRPNYERIAELHKQKEDIQKEIASL